MGFDHKKLKTDETSLVVNEAYAKKHLTRTRIKRLKAVS